MTTLFNILDNELKNNKVIIKGNIGPNIPCNLTFHFDPNINIYVKLKDELNNIYFNNIEHIVFFNTIGRYGKSFKLILKTKPEDLSTFNWDDELMDKETLSIFNEEMNEYKMVKPRDENYYYVELQLSNTGMRHAYVIDFIMPYIDNTDKEIVERNHRLYVNKENMECDTRIYDNDFIKFLNKFYVEYVN